MRLDDLPVARLAAALKGPPQGETESFRGLQNHGFIRDLEVILGHDPRLLLLQ
jgi:hypothetical protein